MNSNEYILAFADIPDDLIRSASDDTAVRRVFRQHRSRRNQMLGALCCCIVVAVAAVGFGSQNWFRKTPPVLPSDTNISDQQITGQPASQPTEPQPGVIPAETVETKESDNGQPTTVGEQPTASDKETQKPVSNTEDPAVPPATSAPDRQEPTTQAPTDTPSDDTSVIWGEEGGVSSSSYETWNGKQVGYELWEILQKNTAGKAIAIVASPAVNAQFVYNGKTIARYEDEAYYERRGLPEKLHQLLKEGDVLKYGEALYTIGTPDGEIWARDFYESRIAYYGTELLSRYIVNGNFLADQVAADLVLAEQNTAAQDAYDEAVSAFYSQTVAAAASAYSAAGLQCSVTGSGNALLFFASADRFAGLTTPGNVQWYFSLAQKKSGETVRE